MSGENNKLVSEKAATIDCTHRCQRAHTHCELRLSRSVAPADLWHWCVIMPDGHIYAIRSGMSLDAAVKNMKEIGVMTLLEADAKWRENHKTEQGNG